MTRTNATLRSLRACVVAAALGAASSAAADPVAFSADEVSGTVTVVDVNTGIVRATIAVSDTFPREPRDVAVDPKSGRVFVAADGQLISFDGRQPDGRGMHRVLARANGSSLAIDERGRRVFMAHEETSQSTGVVSEFSIADPIRPTLVREHVVPGMTDLRLVAYDWPNARVYVVDDDGKIARTGRGDTSFAYFGDLSGAPGGILVDPMGGVWVSIRGSTNGKLFRLTERGALTRYTFMGYSQPRGIAWDVLAPGTILVAIDATPGQIMRFTPSTGALTLVMSTDPKPQDVGVTAGGARVSVNRVASGVDGTMTKNAAYLAPTGEKPVALAVTELARLTADPPSKGFCYSRIGDTAEQTFTIQNTRIDRGSIDLLPVAFGGANPANYQLVGTNSCSAARLQWGQSCAFRVRFTASGPSVEPPPRFGTVLTASWPAEAIVSGTGGSATTRIPLRGAFSLNSCYTLPPLIPTSPIYTSP